VAAARPCPQAGRTVEATTERGLHDRADALAWRDATAGVAAQRVSLAELINRYLAVHTGAETTKEMLRWKLDKALVAFGAIPPSALTREEVERWRLTIPEGHRFETIQALKQTLRWAGQAGLVERHHPALDVKNPQPTRTEVEHFATWSDVEALADEIDPRYSALVIFAAGTGLRPGEWIVLERRDLDLKSEVPTATVRRRMTKDRKILDVTKNGKHRRVPLRPKVAAALDEMPVRLDSRLVFPAARGGLIDLHNWREDYWHPAMIAAGFVTDSGKPDRGPYALRHTYATWALRAGLPTFTVARRMGTSVEMIEKNYGHLAHDAEEWEMERLIAFDAESGGRIVDAEEIGQ
jgi:integrase